ncbi:hypothetical protein PoB_003430100 [Plakobranchus ocellatus]|uniref:Uncharacterized protein n=1 Tax=Plakobranchus ocellatus TaxID=259542 RepID=A0AAV4A9C4_9GAST|nr:hypothetical protein PoB_003430100 [Plakobranchus ocellatus]
MHAAIKREKKFIDTFTTIDWKTIFVSSWRKNPYKVTLKDHTQFTDFKLVSGKLIKNQNRDENGDIVNWLHVKSFQYRYDTPNLLLYRYGFEEQFKQIKLRGQGKHPSVEELPLNPIYNKTLPITQQKSQMGKKLVILESIMLGMPASQAQIHRKIMHQSPELMTLSRRKQFDPQQDDPRLSGSPPDQGPGGGARTRDRRVPANLRADSLATMPPTPPCWHVSSPFYEFLTWDCQVYTSVLSFDVVA